MGRTISRRQFFRKIGFGLANISVLSFSGCQNQTKYGIPRITTEYLIPDEKTTSLLPQKKLFNRPVLDDDSKWLPISHHEDKSRWNAIIIHHTATERGPASIIDKSHRNLGYNGLGYNFIINNGQGNPDGLVEVGYRWKRQLTGAHCRSKGHSDNYWNKHSIGIALIGNFQEHYPTSQQYESLAELIVFLKKRYSIPERNILGHKQVPGCSTKCPGRNFDWEMLNSKIYSFS